MNRHLDELDYDILTKSYFKEIGFQESFEDFDILTLPAIIRKMVPHNRCYISKISVTIHYCVRPWYY